MNVLSILASLVGGVFKGVPLAWVQHRKNKKEEKAAIYRNRPEMAIEKYEFYEPGKIPNIESPRNLEIFVARFNSAGVLDNNVNLYQETDLRREQWCCAEYHLKNKGNTNISCLTLSAVAQQNASVLELDRMQSAFANRHRQYVVYYDHKIRVNDDIILRLYWNAERVSANMVSAAFKLNLEDENGRFWYQPLFAPENQLYDSKQMKYEEYKKEINGCEATKCFDKPWLW